MVYETTILLDAYPLKNQVKTDSGKRNKDLRKFRNNKTFVTVYHSEH